MAQMPRGEPRSVPDSAGEQYDAMLREEELKRQRSERAAAKPPSSLDAEYFSHFNRLDFLRQAPRRDPIVAVGGREIDPRCVLVRADNPPGSPTELAERRRAIERAFFMADHPLAGVAYGLAALTNASPRARDAALIAGGSVDAAMLGAAPRGARSVAGRRRRKDNPLRQPRGGPTPGTERSTRTDRRQA
jgi:hypothetical protein